MKIFFLFDFWVVKGGVGQEASVSPGKRRPTPAHDYQLGSTGKRLALIWNDVQSTLEAMFRGPGKILVVTFLFAWAFKHGNLKRQLLLLVGAALVPIMVPSEATRQK